MLRRFRNELGWHTVGYAALICLVLLLGAMGLADISRERNAVAVPTTLQTVYYPQEEGGKYLFVFTIVGADKPIIAETDSEIISNLPPGTDCMLKVYKETIVTDIKCRKEN